jgi:hypothetical protein
MLFPFVKPRAQVHLFRKGGAGEAQGCPRLCAGFVFVYRGPVVFIPVQAALSLFSHD